MKKIKIMLLSLALFAVVGGALAFKAKFSHDWCIAPSYGNGFTCTTLFQENTFITDCVDRGNYDNAGAVLSCTTVPDGALGCAIGCPVQGFVKKND